MRAPGRWPGLPCALARSPLRFCGTTQVPHAACSALREASETDNCYVRVSELTAHPRYCVSFSAALSARAASRVVPIPCTPSCSTTAGAAFAIRPTCIHSSSCPRTPCFFAPPPLSCSLPVFPLSLRSRQENGVGCISASVHQNNKKQPAPKGHEGRRMHDVAGTCDGALLPCV